MATVDIRDVRKACSKSTLLRMLAGLEKITSGEIAIGGKVVNAVPVADYYVSSLTGAVKE